jgi:hypothetical protein
MRWIRYILVGLLVLVTLPLVLGAVAVAMLPATSCRVTDAHYEVIRLEVPYAEIIKQLGCDGQLVSKQDFGPDLHEEIFAWRGSCWPYQRLDLTFYNRVAHVKSHRRLCLNLTGNRG